MSQNPTERVDGSSQNKSNARDSGDARANNLDASIHKNASTTVPKMVSDKARPDAALPMENGGETRVRFSMKGEHSSHERRRQLPALSLDTSSPILDERIARSYLAARSPLSAGAGASTQPQSPKANTRNRGYSLRTSLFNKNIQSQPGSDGVVIEMEPPESSSRHLGLSISTGKNEKRQSSVTVSTFEVNEDSSTTSRPTQFGDTLAERKLAFWRLSLLRARQELTLKLRSSYQKVKKTLLRMNEIPPTADGRHINLDFSDPSTPIDERTGVPYVSNIIRSSRYTLINFFPRQLFAQFSKLANFYFLIVSILQMIPGLSTTGTYTTIIPLLIFVSVSMAKEGYDDIRRWRLDKEENNRDALVLQSAWNSQSQDKTQWRSTKWHDIKVGDVLLLKRNDPIPADLVLLHADDLSGVAYIEV
jgi:phospholipid-translocating ATPase